MAPNHPHFTNYAIILAAILSFTGRAAAQSAAPGLKIIHSFQGGSKDGSQPMAGVVPGSGGVLYGTTTGGGPSNLGTVFALKPPAASDDDWTEKVIYSFSGDDGAVPSTTLVRGPRGVLYGATGEGGGAAACSGGCGTVFSLTPPSTAAGSWTEAVLYRFTGGSDGSSPTGLAIGSGGVLYGTTNNIATTGLGTVFSLTPPATAGGAWAETVLLAFSGKDGGDPTDGVTVAGDGSLYGTTFGGGEFDLGVVFRLKPPVTAGGEWTPTVLHSFTGSDGAFPSAGVVIGSGGVLYGAAGVGGQFGDGTIYALTPPSSAGDGWTIDVLLNFDGPNGNSPIANLTIGSGGMLYGTTNVGGASNLGTLFALVSPLASGGSWTEVVLHSFAGSPDGSIPSAPVSIAPGGGLYSTTTSGGTAGVGTVFAYQ